MAPVPKRQAITTSWPTRTALAQAAKSAITPMPRTSAPSSARCAPAGESEDAAPVEPPVRLWQDDRGQYYVSVATDGDADAGRGYAIGEKAYMALQLLADRYPGGVTGAEGLREILKLYADPTDRQTIKQIDGIRSIRYRPIVRRVERLERRQVLVIEHLVRTDDHATSAAGAQTGLHHVVIQVTPVSMIGLG